MQRVYSNSVNFNFVLNENWMKWLPSLDPLTEIENIFLKKNFQKNLMKLIFKKSGLLPNEIF